MLSDANVLEQLPQGMREPCGDHSTQPRRDGVDRVVEAHVSALPIEEARELPSQRRVDRRVPLAHAICPFLVRLAPDCQMFTARESRPTA